MLHYMMSILPYFNDDIDKLKLTWSDCRPVFHLKAWNKDHLH